MSLTDFQIDRELLDRCVKAGLAHYAAYGKRGEYRSGSGHWQMPDHNRTRVTVAEHNSKGLMGTVNKSVILFAAARKIDEMEWGLIVAGRHISVHTRPGGGASRPQDVGLGPDPIRALLNALEAQSPECPCGWTDEQCQKNKKDHGIGCCRKCVHGNGPPW